MALQCDKRSRSQAQRLADSVTHAVLEGLSAVTPHFLNGGRDEEETHGVSERTSHECVRCVHVCQERKAFDHTAASMLAGLSSLGSEEEGERTRRRTTCEWLNNCNLAIGFNLLYQQAWT
jgi:hypothetical protein